MLTSNFVQNGAIVTAYHETGRGEPFVLLHGFTGSKLDFYDQMGWFANKCRVLAPDQRGHGESSNLGAGAGRTQIDHVPYHDDRR